MFWAGGFARILTMAFFLGSTSAALAEEGVWSVSKSSGDVWMTTSGAQQASLEQEAVLKPGDTIRTGRNGRVLLVRGEETILISPNSVIGLPTEKTEGLSTTIVQQAGSILLEVEKRNVKHFEVETPYLAAVVKGTQFRVSVNAAGTSVDVLRGQVEVADFKSGQIAQVMPGQHASAFPGGKPGLSLSGSGTLNPIEQGKPRGSSIERITIPKAGLPAPRNTGSGQVVRALGHAEHGAVVSREMRAASLLPQRSAGGMSTRRGVTHISTALGEVRLNFQKVTHGLARGSESIRGSARSVSNKETVWNSRDGKTTTGGAVGSSQGSINDAGSSNGNAAVSNSAAAPPSVAAAVAAAAPANSNNGNGNGSGPGNSNGASNGSGPRTGNGPGNGNGSGNGNGPANGNAPGNGNPPGNGHGTADNGNGSGNSGNGPGNGNDEDEGKSKGKGNNNGNGNSNDNGNGNGHGNSNGHGHGHGG